MKGVRIPSGGQEMIRKVRVVVLALAVHVQITNFNHL
jgi:hypothetical protein